MAKVIPIGEPENEAEREAIRVLRDGLPEEYRIVHNFELRGEGGQWFEVDLAVVAPHAVYVIDVKATYGEIHVAGGKWQPEGRPPFASPLAKLRQHARQLHGVLCGMVTPANQGLRHVWVEALGILTHPSAVLRDPEGRDRDSVVHLQRAVSALKDPARLPDTHFTREPTLPHMGKILEIFSGKFVRPAGKLPLLGLSWQCEERLTENDRYIEYRARHDSGFSNERVILRVYRADPYLSSDEREAEREHIANAYAALTRLPPHPCVPAARDFFPTERGDGYVLVLNDSPGNTLRVHLAKPALRLTMDQKVRVTEDLLGALAHCHSHGVIHRGVSPDSLVAGLDGRTRLVDFDYARPGSPRERTLAREAVEAVSPAYLAPELKDDFTKCSPASDVYSAGATLYELFTGKPAFSSLEEALDTTRVFPEKAGSLVAGLPEGFDSWLESLCAFGPADRPDTAAALAGFRRLFAPPSAPAPEDEASVPTPEPVDYTRLPPGFELKNKYLVEAALGKGGFGRVYKVVDTYGDVTRALKIITQDRSSTLERMKQEYRTLVQLPDHPNVVRVFDGDCVEGDTIPFLVMEYIEGASVRDLIQGRKLSLPEAVKMGIQVAEGLAHCHRHHVAHGDIKPDNLLWTSRGTVKIIDFNVSVREGDARARAGGTIRYMPPESGINQPENHQDRFDRDVFAMGVTLYEACTGCYPWDQEKSPPAGKEPRDPREISGCEDFSEGLSVTLVNAVSPRPERRFKDAAAFAERLRALLAGLRVPVDDRTPSTSASIAFLSSAGPNRNSFVDYLLTLFSQSRRTNAGTRGLDDMGRAIYVETALDRDLQPAILEGQFKLVIISGNAGDGKTAFIQQLERRVREEGVDVSPVGIGNGSHFSRLGRTFLTNHDGSQDEGDKVNDQVLKDFFAPFHGTNGNAWPTGETRVIAINEGRLADFLSQFSSRFPLLQETVACGLASGETKYGVTVVNLNLRSVAAGNDGETIIARLVRRLTAPKFWASCQGCDLRDKCYVRHNALTFANPNAGGQVIARLELLYRLAILRGRLHITLRDLRSALAFMIAGTRDCAGIHELYQSGCRSDILRSLYFNSYVAGGGETGQDRLLKLLGELDVGKSGDPRLDRGFDFHPPYPSPLLMDFDGRPGYDRELLQAEHADLPMDYSLGENLRRLTLHRGMVEMLRRRHFFEARDESWRKLIPYDAAWRMLSLLREETDSKGAALQMINAINRGEGLSKTTRLKGKLALQVRPVETGGMRSYRVFDASRFTLVSRTTGVESPYVEHAPDAILLRYEDMEAALRAEMVVHLDVFEMLDRLNRGYRPTVDELQGYYLSLAVFKNILGSAPYQEVLLTPDGMTFYSVARQADASLRFSVAEVDAEEYHAPKRQG